MKTMKKRVYAGLTAITLATSIFFSTGNIQTFAASRSDTIQTAGAKETATKQSQVQKLSKEFTDLIAYYAFYKIKDNNLEAAFNFSKDSDRRLMLKYTYDKHPNLNKAKQSNLSQQLFGQPVSKKVKQLQGDWGMSVPNIKIAKVSKVSGKQYKATAVLYNDYENTDTLKKVHEKTASVVFQLKKSANAKYGYYVTSISIKK